MFGQAAICAAIGLIMAVARPGPVSWRDAKPTAGAHAMVVTEQHLATQVGLRILKAGGNAVDAAVAVGYALAVVDPRCGNLGGGGFMLVRMRDGRERFIDFREKAPARATRDMFLDRNGSVVPDRSRKGWLAIGVPGTVLGLERAREEYGTMSRASLIAPAAALAREGFVLDAGDEIPLRSAVGESSAGAYAFGNQPNVRPIFMAKGQPPRAGDTIVQWQLAQTLERVAREGPPAFYRGPIARTIVGASNANGGILGLDDFANYRIEESKPLHCAYHGYDIVSAPPPSSGGLTLCEILNIVAPYPLIRWGWHTARSAHYVIEAERRAYADRNAYLGDPDFVRNPVAALLDPAYARKLRTTIEPVYATPSKDVRPGLLAVTNENDDTTHYSIVDKNGNAVAVSYTLNDWFGAGVIAGDTGFFLNDEMDDFTSKPGVPNMFGLVQGERNDVAPGKRPLSSMAPTIVTRDGRLVMVAGSPGGSRIITIVLEILLNALDYRMNVQQAVNAPRLHMQWLPDEVQFEPGALSDATLASLQSRGYVLRAVPSWGSAHVIVVDPSSRLCYGATDRRRPSGAALGY